MTLLPAIPDERDGIVRWVRTHLGHLTCDPPEPSPAFAGGQSAADAALADLDITGYARRRSMVHPVSARGASRLSPYIRHGLLDLPQVWERVDDAPSYDRFRYQGELLWQEYSRHWYAVFGTRTREPLTFEPPVAQDKWPHPPWWREMACIDATLEELHRDGWCVNQTRMWLAGQYSLRGHGDPSVGEAEMFRHLLDGSRAANRMGWQWSAGTSRSRAYNFARAQVTKRAPAYCRQCSLEDDCPISAYAKPLPRNKLPSGPMATSLTGFGLLERSTTEATAAAVWLTAESLGATDPAMAAHPDLPVLFVFDEPLLDRLRLSGKRLIFLAETLGEIQRSRRLDVYLGHPTQILSEYDVAATHAPVPGFERRASAARSTELFPWLWLRVPNDALSAFLHEKSSMPSFKQWCQLSKPEPHAPKASTNGGIAE